MIGLGSDKNTLLMVFPNSVHSSFNKYGFAKYDPDQDIATWYGRRAPGHHCMIVKV